MLQYGNAVWSTIQTYGWQWEAVGPQTGRMGDHKEPHKYHAHNLDIGYSPYQDVRILKLNAVWGKRERPTNVKADPFLQ